MTYAIETRKLVKEYNQGGTILKVLDNVDIKIESGEFMAIMGPSGSGKSTLMNLIGCLDRPTSGRILITGMDISKLSDIELARIRGKKIGFVFQTFNLISRLSAQKNVEMPMVYQDIPGKMREKRAKVLLEMLGLGERARHKPPELSGGQRQRVAIARALANEPEIILADEPTGNLDSKTGQEIMQIFDKLHTDGRTILMVTHDAELARNCDRIIRLKDGMIEHG